MAVISRGWKTMKQVCIIIIRVLVDLFCFLWNEIRRDREQMKNTMHPVQPKSQNGGRCSSAAAEAPTTLCLDATNQLAASILVPADQLITSSRGRAGGRPSTGEELCRLRWCRRRGGTCARLVGPVEENQTNQYGTGGHLITKTMWRMESAAAPDQTDHGAAARAEVQLLLLSHRITRCCSSWLPHH